MATREKAAAFWARPEAEPKRSYKYIVKWIPQNSDEEMPWFLVSSIDLPKATLGQTETHALNHTFKWPGRITWDDINMEVTDSEYFDAARYIVDRMKKAGYSYPDNPTNYRTISKKGNVDAFGTLEIQEITWDEKVIGTWTLRNPWVKSFESGKKAYESDDAQKISMTITYDWAEYVAFEPETRPLAG